MLVYVGGLYAGVGGWSLCWCMWVVCISAVCWYWHRLVISRVRCLVSAVLTSATSSVRWVQAVSSTPTPAALFTLPLQVVKIFIILL